MKKNKKLIYVIVFSFIFVFFFFLTIFLLANRHWFYPYETAIKYEYSDSLDDKIDDLKDSCEKLLIDQNDYDKFITEYNELEDCYSELNTYYKIEYLNYCNKHMAANIRLMNIYSEKKTDLYNWLGSLYSKIYNSKYKNQFYEGFDENDINYIIKSHSEEATKKEEEISVIQDKYTNLSDTEQKNQFNYYFKELINKNNEYAKIVGYENYYDYANERDFNRDYTKDDMLIYADYINKYFIGNYKKHDGLVYDSISYYKEHSLIMVDDLSKYKYSEWEKMGINGDINAINLYSESLGSDYYNEYLNFKNDGILIESNEKDCYDGAFTTYLSYLNKPAMYLGNTTYQNVYTYLHEFGHYYNFTKSKANNVTLDLCETHSQANELLFLSYLLKNKILSFSWIRDQIATRLQFFIQMAVNTTVIGLVEYEAYNKGTVTEDMIANIIDETVEKYMPNVFDIFVKDTMKNYIKSVIIDHPMYYFSYSTSICSSLNLFSLSLKSYTDAKDKYLYIQDNENYDGYIKTLENAGLTNPFEEELYIDLNDLYKNIEEVVINKYS